METIKGQSNRQEIGDKMESQRTEEMGLAMSRVEDMIKTRMKEGGIGDFDAAREVLAFIRSNHTAGKEAYRLEQSAAKKVAYLEAQAQADSLRAEIERMQVGANNVLASNDEKYSVAA